MSDSDKPYSGWAVVEILGHRRLGGRVSQAEQYGVAMLRVDVPGEDGEIAATTFVGGASIYALTPCSEEAARAVAKSNRVEPIARWELPQLEAPKGATRRINCLECGDPVTVGAHVGSVVCSTCGEGEAPDYEPAATFARNEEPPF